LPCCECCILSFGRIPNIWILWTDISEHPVHLSYDLWQWNRQSVPKRWHIKFRCRGITHKVHMTYEEGTDSVLKCRHIKFRCRGITQKKEYKTHKTCIYIHTNKKLIRWKYHIHCNNFYQVIVLNTDETTNATAVHRIFFFLLFSE
jgi:hypothetical protein